MIEITEKDIVDCCGEKAFERGFGYYREKRVKNVTVFGNTIKSTVVGTARYIVEISIDGNDIDGRCTCPVGDSCKHVVATLLYFKKNEKQTTKIDDIESYLNGLPKDGLVRLIVNTPSESMLKAIKLDMARRKKGGIDVEAYREEINNTLEMGHYFDYSETFDLVADIKSIRNELEKIIDSGFYDEACSLAVHLLKCCIKKEEECDDSNGDVGSVAVDVGNTLCKALKKSNIDDIFLHELIKIYKNASEYGMEEAIYSAIKGLDSKNLKKLETLVKNRKEREFRWFSREIINDQGRHEEYIKMCCDDKDYREAIEKLQELGRLDDAIKLAKEKSRTDRWLLDMLFDLLVQKGNNKEALACAWRIFEKNSDEETLQNIKETSTKLGRWKEEKKKAIEFLEKSGKDNDLLVLLCIEENDLRKALKNMKGVEDETVAKLAAALETEMPEASIDIYKELVEDNIGKMGNDHYKAAVAYLKKMKKLHKTRGIEKEWDAYIKSLQEMHKPKRNFISMTKDL